MLEQAKKRLDEYAHIKSIQGDAGNLQMNDEPIDVIVSMNGFHAKYFALGAPPIHD